MATASCTTLSKLPLEILQIIIESLPPSGQHSLSLVSILFHTLTIRPLYTHIRLETPTELVRCCRTLATRSNVAAVVRSFSFSFDTGNTDENHLSSFYNIFRDGLKSAGELQDLRILVNDAHYSTFIKDLVFPRLHHFECLQILNVPLVEFLNRHPQILFLKVSPHDRLFADPPLPDLKLPNLQYYGGNSGCVSILDSCASLRAACICWDVLDRNPLATISNLAKSSSDSLNFLACRRRGWNFDLFEAVSCSLQDIAMLCVNNILIVDEFPSKDFVEAMKVPLSRFRRLQRLAINCIGIWYIDELGCNMDDDFSTVTAWGSVCPTLYDISLPHSNHLSWFRISENVWVPDPQREEATRWLASKTRNRGSPTFGPIVDYFERSVKKPSLSLTFLEVPSDQGVGGSTAACEQDDPQTGTK